MGGVERRVCLPIAGGRAAAARSRSRWAGVDVGAGGDFGSGEGGPEVAFEFAGLDSMILW